MSIDATFWNALAEKYARKPVEDQEAFERKIDITNSRMTPQDVILDIGCGTGSLALRLGPFSAEVRGLDFSSEMIRIAADKVRAQNVDNVTLHIGPFDGSFTKFEEGRLDGICAYSLLHLVENRPATLELIYRLLKPGGFFISSTVCLGETWFPYGPILNVMRWFGKAPMVDIFTTHILEDELRRAGFVEIAQPEVGVKATIAFLVALKPR